MHIVAYNAAPDIIVYCVLYLVYQHTDQLCSLGPQIVVSVYGVNSLGRDEVRGYGCIHLPITPGQYVQTFNVHEPY